MQVWVKVCLPVLAAAALACVLIGFGGPENRGAFIVIMAVASVVLAWINYRQVAQLGAIADHIGRLAEGDLDHRRTLITRDDEIGTIATSTDRIARQLRDAVSRAEALSRGELGELDLGDRARRPRRLSDVNLPVERDAGPLTTHLVGLHNRMRQLTVQAHIIANDELDDALLSEAIDGELGVAFGAMIDNLRALADRASGIAHGDLTRLHESDGALANAFDEMVSGLRGVVDEISDNTLHFSTSAEEIIAVLRDQELAASHQASSVEETQRTMETLLSSARRIAESAQTVFKSAERTQANNRLIADRAAELKSHTERIGEILESIKEIADRSDLLALNASLEGLRAGEAGKGFTLVAAEMRRLAENIKASVGDVKELLSDIRESALSSAMAIEEGTRLSERTTESALKITLITQQQQSGTEQVTQSMEELSHLINQGLAGTRQVTTAAGELSELSNEMRSIGDNFLVDGADRSTSLRVSGGFSSRGRPRGRESGTYRRLPAAVRETKPARNPSRRKVDTGFDHGATMNLGISPLAVAAASSSQSTEIKGARKPDRQQQKTPVSTSSQDALVNPTVDVSQASDELRDLFEGQKESSANGESSSIEETFDAIERQLDEDSEADS
jgi:methyl-accepting chemotaxis protein